jgi:DNA-binding NtrC family response regulator
MAPAPARRRRNHGGHDMQDPGATGAVMIDIDAELSCWQQMESSATSELVFLFQEWEPAIRVGMSYAEIEGAMLLKTLEHVDGDKRATAAELGVSTRTIHNQLARLRQGRARG